MLYKVIINYRLRFFNFFFLGIVILFINASTFGQDTLVDKSTTVSFEGQIYPAFNTDIYTPQFKVRLNLNDHSAIRLNSSFSRDVAYNEILEIGGSLDFMKQYVKFRGCNPKADGLLKVSGISV